MTRTKIVATIGPASESEDTITQLIRAGVDVVRFNTKHADVSWHEKNIEKVKRIRANLNKPVGILLDLQGPEIRIETPSQAVLNVSKDEEIYFSADFISNIKTIKVPNQHVIEALNIGNEILINDGYFSFKVVAKDRDFIIAKAEDDYEVGNHKGMNLPGVKLNMPSISDRDWQYLDLAQKVNPEFVALSFVRSKEDIEILKNELKKRKVRAHIVAKIEGQHAVDNIDAIIDVSDVIMVARGDLGVELPIEQITFWQKKIIKKCRLASRPVITATEMLQSMIENSRPTRAEVSDVANAVFDRSDAIMLSGETAQGKYPLKVVQMMEKIAKFNEGKLPFSNLRIDSFTNQSKIISHAVVDMLRQQKEFQIDAIVVFTETGRTALDLARFHPNLPVIAITEDEFVRNVLAIAYGVTAYKMNLPDGEILEINSVIDLLKNEAIVKSNQRIVFIHGDKWKIPGLTNTISVKEIN